MRRVRTTFALLLALRWRMRRIGRALRRQWQRIAGRRGLPDATAKRMTALRQRYPGAPQHWLQFIASHAMPSAVEAAPLQGQARNPLGDHGRAALDASAAQTSPSMWTERVAQDARTIHRPRGVTPQPPPHTRVRGPSAALPSSSSRTSPATKMPASPDRHRLKPRFESPALARLVARQPGRAGATERPDDVSAPALPPASINALPAATECERQSAERRVTSSTMSPPPHCQDRALLRVSPHRASGAKVALSGEGRFLAVPQAVRDGPLASPPGDHHAPTLEAPAADRPSSAFTPFRSTTWHLWLQRILPVPRVVGTDPQWKEAAAVGPPAPLDRAPRSWLTLPIDRIHNPAVGHTDRPSAIRSEDGQAAATSGGARPCPWPALPPSDLALTPCGPVTLHDGWRIRLREEQETGSWSA